MSRLIGSFSLISPIAALALGSAVLAETVINPDEIGVFFPRLEGEGNLGKNVATVLSLQLAQTGRKNPWPDNPEGHDFNLAVMTWAETPLEDQTHTAAISEATNDRLLAQLVVWGETYNYAGAVIADVNITLPHYAAPSDDCSRTTQICDFRQANYETWNVQRGQGEISVGPPRRRFSLSAIRLRPDIVERFKDIEGLPIRASLRGGPILGYTGTDIRFLEFNPRLDGAPTKLTSQGVTGYVTLPQISNEASEYADMIGGILQVFRGDWESAQRSFAQVIEKDTTRTPLLVDALLYKGMATFRNGGDGMSDFLKARELAPFDRRAVQYELLGRLTRGETKDLAASRDLIANQRHLFAPQDPWIEQAIDMVSRR